MKLAYTRKIIDAIHDGSLLQEEYSETPIFGLHVPKHVNGVPAEILRPENMVRSSRPILQICVPQAKMVGVKLLASSLKLAALCEQWNDKNAYTETLTKLAGLFKKNFLNFTDHKVGGDGKLTEEILAAGPQ